MTEYAWQRTTTRVYFRRALALRPKGRASEDSDTDISEAEIDARFEQVKADLKRQRLYEHT